MIGVQTSQSILHALSLNPSLVQFFDVSPNGVVRVKLLGGPVFTVGRIDMKYEKAYQYGLSVVRWEVTGGGPSEEVDGQWQRLRSYGLNLRLTTHPSGHDPEAEESADSEAVAVHDGQSGNPL